MTAAKVKPAPKLRRRGRVIALIVTATMMTFACSSDGDGPLTSVERPEQNPPAEAAPEDSAPAENPPAETAPSETVPAETAPAETAPVETTPVETSGDDSNSNAALILIILGALVVVGLIAALVARRSKGGAGAASSQQARLDGIIGNARAIHDSTVLTVLQPNEPAGLQSVWSVAQRQLVDLEVEVTRLTAEVTDAAAQPVLKQLGLAIAGMRGALESNVSLRLGSEAQAALVEASNQTALTRRAELEAALQQAAYLQL